MLKVMVSLMPMGPGQTEKHIPLDVPVDAPSDADSFDANRDAAFKAASYAFEYTNTNAAWPHRSLSVGDIVQVQLREGRILMVVCCSVGWALLSPVSRKILRAFNAWGPETPLQDRAMFVDAVQSAERMAQADRPADLMRK